MSILHNVIFQVIKRGKKAYDPDNPPDYVKKRMQEERTVPNKLPRGIQCKKIELENLKGEYLYTESNQKKKHIVYIHGGGFVSGSTKTVRPLVSELVKRTGCNVVSIEYRLAPEYPFPSAPEDCFKAYCTLEKKFGGSNIILMGESAGGNLVLTTVLQAKDKRVPLPAGIVVMAPTIQFDHVFPSYYDNLDTDCMISNLQQEIREVYLQSDEPSVLHNPYAAPYYGDYTGFPPTFVIVSDSEVLRDDSLFLYKKLVEAGVKSKLSLFHKMMHIFQVTPSLPESRQAYRQIKDFIKDIILQDKA
ncbi:MAG: alpha/beta hydrolase [Eubacteriales bacterium]|nr:alpha/beta hydrolase [Eubacteriales bacterium]